MARYLVIGGGITGLSAALDLATSGHEVEVVEKKSIVGGEVLSYCCKATDSCARCGVCAAHRRMAEALRHERVHVHTGAGIRSAAGGPDKVTLQITGALPSIDYRLCVACDRCVEACPEKCITRSARAELVQYRIDHGACRLHRRAACSACVDTCPTGAITAGRTERLMSLSGRACLVATGHTPFAPDQKPRYGYGRVAGVITGREAEEILSRQRTLGENVRDVAFVQCVGSRDPAAGRSWCSAACCAYAVRLARVLRYRDPGVKVTVYYIDLQNFDKCFADFRHEVTMLGVELVRGVPFRMDQTGDGRVRVSIEAEGETPAAREHDRVVLSVGLGPTQDSAALAGLLELDVSSGGFFRSPAENVLVAGTCARPQTIPECIGEAGAMASRMQGLGA